MLILEMFEWLKAFFDDSKKDTERNQIQASFKSKLKYLESVVIRDNLPNDEKLLENLEALQKQLENQKHIRNVYGVLEWYANPKVTIIPDDLNKEVVFKNWHDYKFAVEQANKQTNEENNMLRNIIEEKKRILFENENRNEIAHNFYRVKFTQIENETDE